MKEVLDDSFRVYSTQDVARILQVDNMTVRRYVKSGKLKKLPTGGAVRISHKELDRFINGSNDE
jgi:excisionase family DNA binding protein